jgi:hypothetical protein
MRARQTPNTCPDSKAQVRGLSRRTRAHVFSMRSTTRIYPLHSVMSPMRGLSVMSITSNPAVDPPLRHYPCAIQSQ